MIPYTLTTKGWAAARGCKITLLYKRPGDRFLSRCDEPVVAHGLCAKHEGDRVRLGGAA